MTDYQKICIIGTCGHTKQAYRSLKARSDVVFCGIAPGSTVETLALIDKSIPQYGDYRTMLAETSPTLAVVSPVFGKTAEVITECARRGIDVFAEKPIAATLTELDALERTIRDSGIRFSAMHYLRFSPAFYRGAELVRGGAIGDVKMITAQKSYRYGTRPAWYGDRALYGGTIPWVGIHAIDWIYHFSGKRFRSVTAASVGRDPEMAALCQFKMEDGLIASVNIDFYRPKGAPTHGDDRIRLVGTKGVLEVRDERIVLFTAEGVTVETPTDAPELLTEFLAGKDPIPQSELFYLTRIALLARESADTGNTVRIED